VELGEIEAVISEIDGVVETVIKPLRTAEGDYKLIAFLSVPENFSMEPAEIGKYIRTKLPPYMVPSAFKFMNGFPRNINGKIDRKALVYDVVELEKKEEGGKTPLTDIEKVIYDIWCATLKTKNISVTDNFFDIGGNSLMAISVFSKIETAFNIDLGLRLFFDSPRIKDLADILEVKLNISEEPRHVSQNGNGRSRTVKGEI
jgi:acyl carrier protein